MKEEPKVEEETKKPGVEFVHGLILRIQVQGGRFLSNLLKFKPGAALH